MPLWRPARQGREKIYRERATEIVAALRILAQSKKPLLAEFGRHWLEDYEPWVEHTAPQKAA